MAFNFGDAFPFINEEHRRSSMHQLGMATDLQAECTCTPNYVTADTLMSFILQEQRGIGMDEHVMPMDFRVATFIRLLLEALEHRQLQIGTCQHGGATMAYHQGPTEPPSAQEVFETSKVEIKNVGPGGSPGCRWLFTIRVKPKVS